MKQRLWYRIWIILSIVLLFFPAVFIIVELPTEDRLYRFWSQQIVWKTHNEVPEYNGLGPWVVRQRYAGIPDRELIPILQSTHKTIDFSTINKKYQEQINTLKQDQFGVIIEAILVYLLVVFVLYSVGWSVDWIIRGTESGRRNQ